MQPTMHGCRNLHRVHQESTELVDQEEEAVAGLEVEAAVVAVAGTAVAGRRAYL